MSDRTTDGVESDYQSLEVLPQNFLSTPNLKLGRGDRVGALKDSVEPALTLFIDYLGIFHQRLSIDFFRNYAIETFKFTFLSKAPIFLKKQFFDFDVTGHCSHLASLGDYKLYILWKSSQPCSCGQTERYLSVSRAAHAKIVGMLSNALRRLDDRFLRRFSLQCTNESEWNDRLKERLSAADFKVLELLPQFDINLQAEYQALSDTDSWFAAHKPMVFLERHGQNIEIPNSAVLASLMNNFNLASTETVTSD